MDERRPGDVRRVVFELFGVGGLTHQQIADEVRRRLPGAKTTRASVASMSVAYKRQIRSASPARRPARTVRVAEPPIGFGDPDAALNAIEPIIRRARQVAVDYYAATGRPLGITGEVGEFEAARLLGLKLAAAREPGYDATDASGRRYQIKTRSWGGDGGRRSQRMGGIKFECDWEVVLLVLLDRDLQVTSIWQAQRTEIEAALAAPGSRARNERGALAVSKFQALGGRVWPPAEKALDKAYLQSLQFMLSEWDSPEDAEAFNDL